MHSQVEKLIRKGTAAPFPTGIKPMLCTLIKEPFTNSDYVFEVKWDGYRLIAYVENGRAVLKSRSGLDYSRRYPSVVNALSGMNADLVMDGEAVVLNREGKPDFDALQKFNAGKGTLMYYIFDLLWYSGYNLMNLPLLERKEILKHVIEQNHPIRYCDHFEDGLALYNQMKRRQLEGVIAKQKHSPYCPGERGNKWYKIPVEQIQEFVIGGWVESDKRPFRSLLFGSYRNGRLEWVGHAAGGFNEKEMPEILKVLRKREIKESPFVNPVEANAPLHWVRPELVANIKFATYTKSGRIRKPAIFTGFRQNKAAG